MSGITIKKQPKQKQAIQLLSSSAKYIMLFGGSRSGKTFILVYAIIIRALKYPHSRHVIVRKTFADVKRTIGMDTMPKTLELMGINIEPNRADWLWKLPNGSEIWLSGLDDKNRAEKILGMEFVTIYLNEISQISFHSYEVIRTRLSMRIEGCINKMYLDCNPPSKNHWCHKIFIDLINPASKQPLINPESYKHLLMNPEDNVENLPEDYIDDVLKGLSVAKQQRFLLGRFSDEAEGDLWTEMVINKSRVSELFITEYTRIIIGVDPSGDDGKNDGIEEEIKADEIGIVVCGESSDGQYYVLEDASLHGSPTEWASRVIRMYYKWKADLIVAESNFGGAMVEAVIRSVTDDDAIRVKLQHSARGKIPRADPIVALWEQNKAHCIGVFDELEEEMTTYKIGDPSPNRMDAMVFGMTELSGGAGKVNIHTVAGNY